jgi:hypothetical protein
MQIFPESLGGLIPVVFILSMTGAMDIPIKPFGIMLSKTI